MELLVTLTNLNLLERLAAEKIDGIIFGGLFSNKYNYTNEEIVNISDYLKQNNIKQYISIDTFIGEDDLLELDKYLNFLNSLDIDGLYFNDLSIIQLSQKYNFKNKLIYDPSTLTTNSNDIGYYLNTGIDCVLARELSLEEIVEIIKKHPYKLDMQIFGHLRMSYSKRKFLSNYFKEIDREVDIENKDSITLVEESRNYRLPIKETKYGTCIYTDYILLMYAEYFYLNKLIKRAIIDTEFVFTEVVFDVLRDIKRLNAQNAEFLEDSLKVKYQQYSFSNGYLYQKTTDKKQDDE